MEVSHSGVTLTLSQEISWRGNVTLTEGWTLRYPEVEGETVCGHQRLVGGCLLGRAEALRISRELQ